MTEDQIKTIASKLAEQISPSLNHPASRLSAYRKCFLVLCALADHYCIVEREKVKNYLQQIKEQQSHNDELLHHRCEGKLTAINTLFGTSMFNQNEEEK